eukprot:scaffold12053_cov37-Prasinocladus_malaysianus.AAC.2
MAWAFRCFRSPGTAHAADLAADSPNAGANLRQGSRGTEYLTENFQASAAKKAGGPGILQMLSKPAVWAIVVVNFINHWGYFIYLNWL